MNTAAWILIGALGGFAAGVIYRDIVYNFYKREVVELRAELKSFTDFITKKIPSKL